MGSCQAGILILIAMFAQERKLPANLVHAVVLTESSCRVDAVGPYGEIGLMQLRPRYFKPYTKKQLFNPINNIALGTKHLKYMKNNCPHQKNYTWVVCYNTGVRGSKDIKHPKKHPYYRKVMKKWAKVR